MNWMWNSTRSFALLFFLAACSYVPTTAIAADKSDYHLFNPVPADQLRELATDRPDRTESPYSVDAGHFQFEIDLVNRSSTGSATETLIGGINVKAGLTDSIDLQLVAEPSVTTTLGDTSKSALGDTALRLKWNLFGNNEGATALALMPYVNFPTRGEPIGASSASLGLAIPFAYSLPENFSGAFMLEPTYSLVAGSSFNDNFTFGSMATFSHALWGEVDGYVEFYNELSSAPWIATLDLGLTWVMTSNLQWDIGANFGATDTTEDLNVFAGVSFRL